MRNTQLQIIGIAAFGLVLIGSARTVLAAQPIKVGMICSVEGQQESYLQGWGIVVGLNGTGDGNFTPMMKSLANAMQIGGVPIDSMQDELKNAKNVAWVRVTATVPATGARRGEKIDCRVSGVAAKSLEHGRLIMAPLVGPELEQDPIVYGVARGNIIIEDKANLNNGVITGGCQLEENFVHTVTQNGKVTLNLDKNHTGWQMALAVQRAINNQLQVDSQGTELAQAVSPVSIVVDVPNTSAYENNLVEFIALVMLSEIPDDPSMPRVTINRATGTIVISEDVEIAKTGIAHKNLMIMTGDQPGAFQNGFVGLDVNAERTALAATVPPTTQNPTLQGLVDALNTLDVPTEDQIAILQTLEKNGSLYARLVIE